MLAKIDAATHHLIGADGFALDFMTPRLWFGLVARAQREQEAADWLRRSRLFAYWPNYLVQVAGGNGRRRSRFASVIPSMMFIAAPAATSVDPWPIVRQTPGIIGYVRDGAGRAATLDDHDIEVIRHIEAGLNIPPRSGHHRFKLGDKVRFCDDLMGRWPPGRIKTLAKDGRIAIEVSLLGRAVSIWAAAHQIEAM